MRTIYQIKTNPRTWANVSREAYEKHDGAKRVRQLPRIVGESARQAIVTNYRAPTNTRPSKIMATADAGKMFVSYDSGAGDTPARHRVGADALAAKFGWDNPQYYGPLACGSLPGDKGYVFVEMPRAVDRMMDALGDLLQYVVGNRGPRDGNPYRKPEVIAALNALFLAQHGREPNDDNEAMNAANPWFNVTE